MKWIVLALVGLNIWFFAWRVAKPLPAPAVPTEVTHPQHVNRLLMISEVDGGELRDRTTPQPGVDMGADTPTAIDATCFRVGPFDTADDVARVKAWLEDAGANTAVKRGERRELALYWVFLPPLADRDAAVKQVLTMREAGIEDISAIARGDMANAISLGVYSRRASLDRRLAELKAHGHAPSVSPRYRTKKAAWLEAIFPKDSEFAGDEFQSAFADAKIESAPCVGRDEAPRAARAAPNEDDAAANPKTDASKASDKKQPKPDEKAANPFPQT